MKKYLIAVAMFALLLIGITPANATEEPNGEESIVILTAPTALNNCANSPEDISGVEDVYVPYGKELVLVATYAIIEDAEGFAAIATLQSKYYSLSNPFDPGRSTSVTFTFPRCATAEFPPKDQVIVPPVVAPPAPVDPPLIPAPEPDPIIPAPLAPIEQAPVADVPVPSLEPAAVLTQSKPVVRKQLAATGANETWAAVGGTLVIAGIILVLLNRRSVLNSEV